MNKRVVVDGESFSLFKGKFAKVVVRIEHGKRGWEVRQTINGKRTKKVFAFDALREANNYARAAESERMIHGAAATMREDDRLAVSFYHRWEEGQREQGCAVPSLFSLVQEACSRFEQRREAATWQQAAEAYVRERGARLNPQRMRVVNSVVTRFSESLPSPAVLLDDVSVADVQYGLAAMLAADAARATKESYLTVLAAIWQLAIDRRLATYNPAAEARKQLPRAKVEQPTFFSVDDCEKLLAVAWAYPRRDEAFFFVVGLLTGIRLAERSRLQYEDFRLDEAAPYINVPAGKAKTRRQRAVYLQGTHADLIRAFMPAGKASKDVILPYEGRESTQRFWAHTRQQEFAKMAGVELPRNVLRHTAATYLCAHLESMGKAALILGHSESMLVQHYRALVTKAEADRFFAMRVPGL